MALLISEATTTSLTTLKKPSPRELEPQILPIEGFVQATRTKLPAITMVQEATLANGALLRCKPHIQELFFRTNFHSYRSYLAHYFSISPFVEQTLLNATLPIPEVNPHTDWKDMVDVGHQDVFVLLGEFNPSNGISIQTLSEHELFGGLRLRKTSLQESFTAAGIVSRLPVLLLHIEEALKDLHGISDPITIMERLLTPSIQIINMLPNITEPDIQVGKHLTQLQLSHLMEPESLVLLTELMTNGTSQIIPMYELIQNPVVVRQAIEQLESDSSIADIGNYFRNPDSSPFRFGRSVVSATPSVGQVAKALFGSVIFGTKFDVMRPAKKSLVGLFPHKRTMTVPIPYVLTGTHVRGEYPGFVLSNQPTMLCIATDSNT